VSVSQENALDSGGVVAWGVSHMGQGNEENGVGEHDSLAAKVKHAVTRFIYYKICKRAAL